MATFSVFYACTSFFINSMVGTRKSCDALFSIDSDPANVPPAVRKIQPGGSGNRQTSGLARRRATEVTSNNQWALTSPTGNHSPIHPPPPAINIAECSHSETPNSDNPQDSPSNNNVLVNTFDLREMVSENMCCLHCNKSSQKKLSTPSSNSAMNLVGDVETCGYLS